MRSKVPYGLENVSTCLCVQFFINPLQSWTFLEYLYAPKFLQDQSLVKKVIWSDGPNSEFKNKFMRQLLGNLSKKYNKQFDWKLTATSHGKGQLQWGWWKY